MEAQNLWTKGDQLRTDPFNAACMYKMGCVALDQFKVEAAMCVKAPNKRTELKNSPC